MAFQYSPKIVTNGLVVALDAANKKSYPGSGTTWIDLSNNLNNATIYNSPTYSTQNAGIFSLSGTNETIQIPNSDEISFTNTNNFTIEIWVNKTETPGVGNVNGLFAKSSNVGIDYYFGGSQLRAGIRNGIDGQYLTTYSTDLVGWTHCVFTYETENSTGIKLYTQGQLRNSRTTIGLSDFTSTNNYIIGLEGLGGTPTYLIGDVSNTRVYNRVLSSNEILQNYNATKGRFGL